MLTSYDTGREKMVLHPLLVDTTFVVVVMVDAGVLTTSVLLDVRVFVKANTFSGARSSGDRQTLAPDTGHFSCFLAATCRKPTSSLLSSSSSSSWGGGIEFLIQLSPHPTPFSDRKDDASRVGLGILRTTL